MFTSMIKLKCKHIQLKDEETEIVTTKGPVIKYRNGGDGGESGGVRNIFSYDKGGLEKNMVLKGGGVINFNH